MADQAAGGSRRQVGVEEEMLLVDPATGYPVAGISGVQAAARSLAGDDVEHELTEQQVEIASAPFVEIGDVISDLYRRRADLVAAAGARGFAVAATATSPLPTATTITDEPRYHQMVERFGLLGRQQLTCGMHTHVSISSPAEGIAVLDRIRPWLHVLTALSANSPFWQGEDSGYASYRTIIWGQWPTAGPTGRFEDEPTYRRLVAGLIGSGTVLDEGMIYFDARLSRNYPTVEIRVADVCTDVEDAALIAALARGLVDTAAADRSPALPIRTELLRVAAWGAARWGVTGPLLDPFEVQPRSAEQVLGRLVDLLRPALVATGDEHRVETGIARLLSSPDFGTGADHQRDTLARTGSLAAVVADVAERTRLVPG